MRVLIKTGFLMLLLGAILIAASYNILRAEGVGQPSQSGGRSIATETRPITGTAVIVRLNGPVDLQLKQGPTPTLIVRAEQRLLSKIKTVQEGNTLTIDTKGILINANEPFRVELTLPALQELTVHGTGDSVIDGFKGDQLTLGVRGSGDILFKGNYQRVSTSMLGSGDVKLDNGICDAIDLNMLGSGDIAVSGQSKSLVAKMMGSGDLSAGKLQADVVTLDVLGSGSAVVVAKQSVNFTLTGNGDVKVSGNPTQRTISRRGSGEVIWE